MKKRTLLSFVVLVALVCTMAFAAAAETPELPATCPQCGTAANWTGLSTVDAAADTLAAGHYYVDTEEAAFAFTTVKTISDKVCVYVPAGKTLTGPSRVFTVASTGELSLMGEGTVSGVGYTGYENGGVVQVIGGKLNIQGVTMTTNLTGENFVYTGGVIYAKGGTIRMSSGSIQNGKTLSNKTGTSGANGGNIFLTSSAKFYMTGGTIKDGAVTGNKYGSGGNVYIDSACVFDMSGGSITGGTAKVSGGGCVNARGQLKVTGNAVVDGVRLSPVSSKPVADTFAVYGTFTGTVRLRINTSYLVANNAIGTFSDDAVIEGAIILNTLTDGAITDYYLELKDNELTLGSNTREAYCEACGSTQTWTRMTEDSASATEIAEGHYYLSFTDGTADWAQKSISGKVCLDMNGMKIQGIKRVFLVNKNAELSLMGGGTITSGGFASNATNAQRYGGVAYIYAGGKMNVYGGSYKSGLYESTNKKAYQGGIFWTQGELNLHNASVAGEDVQAGGSIFIQSGSVNGKVTIDGGSVTNQIWAKGYLTLKNSPSISKTIVVKNPYLRVEGTLYGEIMVNYENAEAGMVIGTCENLNTRFADFYVTSPMLYIAEQDGNLVLNKFPTIYPYRMEKRFCQACQRECDFAELTDEYTYAGELSTGHYFLNLTDSTSVFEPYMILGKDRVCLDLNGQDWVCNDMAFDLRSGIIFNVMDSVGGGSISGCGPEDVSSPFGGTIMVRGGATLNLYSGTLTYHAPTDDRSAISRGGVVYALGNVNVYGGTVTGGKATSGGNIYIDVDKTYVGHIGLYGGTVTEGTATYGPCIISRGTVLLSGDPTIAQVRRTTATDSPAQGDMLEIRDTFTGSVQFYMPSWNNGMDLGNVTTDVDISNATITFNDSKVDRLLIENGQIYAVKGDVVTVLHNADGTTVAYTDAAAAIAAYDNAEKLALLADLADLELTKDLTVDLNGHSITGNITGTGKLTVLDSKTDDFDISDAAYGKIPVASKAFVQAAEGYLMVEETDGLSFHKIVLNIRSMSLKAKCVGLYFVSEFLGDSLVKEQVKNFGVLLSVDGDPVEVKDTGIVKATRFGKELFNADTAKTSTLVYDVMNEGNQENQTRATMQVYGRPYVTLESGEVLYGTLRNRSLKEQVEAADANWAKLTIAQKNNFFDLYYAYKDVMSAEGAEWNLATALPKIKVVDKFNTMDYTPYLSPWTENVVQKAMADGKIHYYFMAGEGLHISDTQTYKDKWGDACLIVFPNGKTMLVDAGPLSYTPVLVQNLERMGITHLDYFLLTHPHSDHQNGIFLDTAIYGCGLLDKFPVGQIYYRGGYNLDYDRNSDTATLALRIANQYGIPIQPIKKGDVFNFGDVRMEVVWPLAGDGDSLISGGEEINSMSITMRFDYGEHSSLFTGDLYVSGEMNILKKVDHDLLKADFLKVPHHGYATSSCAAFIHAVDPDVAVSTGRLPIPQRIYDRYADLGVELLDDRMKGYIHVTGDVSGELLYETSRETFEGDTTPSDPDEDPIPDEGED